MRAWPDLLDWLSRHKRVTWTLVSASTQPQSFDGTCLVLSIETAGLAETFRRGAHAAFVQEALMEVLGIDARVEGVVAGDARDAALLAGPSPAAAPITTPAALSGASGVQSAPEPSRPTPSPAASAPQVDPARPAPAQRVAEPAAEAGEQVPPAAAARPGRVSEASDWSSVPPPSSSAPSWATSGDDPMERTPSGPVAPVVPTLRDRPGSPPVREKEVVDDPESISDDDEDIEGSGEIGQAVVERLLGGTVINEDDDADPGSR
jgi:DNA polymerase III subunit gamma/tau